MKRLAGAAVLRLLRVASLVLLAVLGTMALLRFAPGYFTDTREMDAEHASIVRQQLQSQQQREGSFAAMATAQLRSWMHGDLGRSRQFDAPVSTLLHDRIRTTARLLAGASSPAGCSRWSSLCRSACAAAPPAKSGSHFL
jgi:peptide/nickel transport system permease protein